MMLKSNNIDALRTRFVNGILDREGGYVNDPADRGGETMWGITAAVARSYGYGGSMRDLPRSVAFDIAAELYWHTLRLDAIGAILPSVAAELADTGVNMGVGTAGRFLQQALNAFNNRGGLWPDLVVDGIVGPRTIAALLAYADHRDDEGAAVLVAALNALQGARYIGIVEADDSQERFAYGWFAERVAKPAHL